MGEPAKKSYFLSWNQKKALPLLILLAYFFPLITAFVTFAALPEHNRALLAFFTCTASLFSILMIVSGKKAFSDNANPAIDLLPHGLEENQYQDPNLIENMQRQIEELEQIVKQQQEEHKDYLSKQAVAGQETVYKMQQTIDRFQLESEKYLQEVQEKNRTITEQDEKIAQLTQEIANTRFELETLLKVECKGVQ